MSLVVVGTDTEVGKTVASAVLVARYARRFPLAYWKPVASGSADGPTDRELVERWVGHLAEVLPEVYSFSRPLSPHLAARLERRSVEPEAILLELVRYGTEDPARRLVIEGVGGVHVPLVESPPGSGAAGGVLLSWLLAEMSLPCVVVARSRVGTINHTLLTLEALRSRGVEVAGVVLSGPRNPENRRAIERFGDVRVVGEIDTIPRLGRAGILRAARGFDRRAELKRYFE